MRHIGFWAVSKEVTKNKFQPIELKFQPPPDLINIWSGWKFQIKIHKRNWDIQLDIFTLEVDTKSWIEYLSLGCELWSKISSPIVYQWDLSVVKISARLAVEYNSVLVFALSIEIPEDLIGIRSFVITNGEKLFCSEYFQIVTQVYRAIYSFVNDPRENPIIF
jgi:hypothetical protein